MRFKRRSSSPLKKKARRGFKGYPAATIAFYGPDESRASKVTVGILAHEGAEPVMARWFSEDRDVRTDPLAKAAILEYLTGHGVKTVVSTERIIGCPHEGGNRLSGRRGVPAVPLLGESRSLDGRDYFVGA